MQDTEYRIQNICYMIRIKDTGYRTQNRPEFVDVFINMLHRVHVNGNME